MTPEKKRDGHGQIGVGLLREPMPLGSWWDTAYEQATALLIAQEPNLLRRLERSLSAWSLEWGLGHADPACVARMQRPERYAAAAAALTAMPADQRTPELDALLMRHDAFIAQAGTSSAFAAALRPQDPDPGTRNSEPKPSLLSRLRSKIPHLPVRDQYVVFAVIAVLVASAGALVAFAWKDTDSRPSDTADASGDVPDAPSGPVTPDDLFREDGLGPNRRRPPSKINLADGFKDR